MSHVRESWTWLSNWTELNCGREREKERKERKTEIGKEKEHEKGGGKKDENDWHSDKKYWMLWGKLKKDRGLEWVAGYFS